MFGRKKIWNQPIPPLHEKQSEKPLPKPRLKKDRKRTETGPKKNTGPFISETQILSKCGALSIKSRKFQKSRI
jgi:hypothetical protein